MKTRQLFAIIIIALLILGAGYVLIITGKTADTPTHKPISTATVGYQVESELLDAAGNPADFKDFAGKVVFVNNWASWCPPCVAEMPTIEQLQTSFQGKDLVFVMVSFDQNREKGLDWMEKKGFELPVYFPGKNYPQEFITNAIPATFVLDKQGKVVHRQMGMADYSTADFKQQMEKLINQ